MMRKHRPFLVELVVVAVMLALVTVGFFWQILLTADTWMPAGGGDLAPFLYPTYRFAAEQLRQGTIPLWNPHLYSGAPFAADIQSGLFYPVNLLLFLLAPNFSYEWLEYLAVFHFWLAGFTMYLCLRRLSTANPLSPAAALAGALARSLGSSVDRRSLARRHGRHGWTDQAAGILDFMNIKAPEEKG